MTAENEREIYHKLEAMKEIRYEIELAIINVRL